MGSCCIESSGANIDCQTLAGKSALHFACENQLPELVEASFLSQSKRVGMPPELWLSVCLFPGSLPFWR